MDDETVVHTHRIKGTGFWNKKTYKFHFTALQNNLYNWAYGMVANRFCESPELSFGPLKRLTKTRLMAVQLNLMLMASFVSTEMCN